MRQKEDVEYAKTCKRFIEVVYQLPGNLRILPDFGGSWFIICGWTLYYSYYLLVNQTITGRQYYHLPCHTWKA